MLSELRSLYHLILPAMATLSLVGGPSQSATQAEIHSRLDREQHADCSGATSQHPPASPCEQKGTPSGQEKDESGFASFVSINSAKPTDGGTAQVALGPAAEPVFNLRQLSPRTLAAHGDARCLFTSHHPPYLAHAPPLSACC